MSEPLCPYSDGLTCAVRVDDKKRIAELEAEVDAIWDKVLAEIERMRSTKRAAITSAYTRGRGDDGFCPKCTQIGIADKGSDGGAG